MPSCRAGAGLVEEIRPAASPDSFCERHTFRSLHVIPPANSLLLTLRVRYDIPPARTFDWATAHRLGDRGHERLPTKSWTGRPFARDRGLGQAGIARTGRPSTSASESSSSSISLGASRPRNVRHRATGTVWRSVTFA